jgi:hypothetical protein
MEAHLLFHLALVSYPARQRKQPAQEAPNKLEKILQKFVHLARFRFQPSGFLNHLLMKIWRINVRAKFGVAHFECQWKRIPLGRFQSQ